MYLAIFAILGRRMFLALWDINLTRKVFLLCLTWQTIISHSLAQNLSLQKRLTKNTDIAIKQESHITTDPGI